MMGPAACRTQQAERGLVAREVDSALLETTHAVAEEGLFTNQYGM